MGVKESECVCVLLRASNKINGNEWLSKWINERTFLLWNSNFKSCHDIVFMTESDKLCGRGRCKREREEGRGKELWYSSFVFSAAYLKLNICTPWALEITKIYFTYAHTSKHFPICPSISICLCICVSVCAWVYALLSFACVSCVLCYLHCSKPF